MDENRESSPRKRGMESIDVVLAAGVPRRFDIEGDYFHVLTAPITDLKARFDESKRVPVYEGVGFRRYYRQFELSSATGQTVTVLVGFGSVHDGRSNANVNVAATFQSGNTLNDGGDVSCTASAATQLLAQDTTRTVAYISNPSSNTQTMRIGTSAVAAATGMLLEPGVTLPLPTTAAIYAYNPHASLDETLSVAVVKQV